LTRGDQIHGPSPVGVCTYGTQGASARVRLHYWLARVAPSAEVLDYAGTSSNSPTALLSHLPATVRGELRVRALSRSRELLDRTVIVSRQASPFSNGGLAQRLLSRAGWGVYDFDDALMVNPRRGPWHPSRQWAAAVRAADVVIAGNAYLAKAALELNARTVVIPSCVEPDDYLTKYSYSILNAPTAVWMGTPSTERYLLTIAKPLMRAHRKHGLRLTVISAGSASLGVLDQMIDRVDWTTSAQRSALRQADFGIMPLPDDEWARGKCAYKLLQYGAAALPLVGSPVGANTDVLSAGDGLAASSPGEWSEAMDTLLLETERRRAARGSAARATVQSNYSYSSWEPAWREATGVRA